MDIRTCRLLWRDSSSPSSGSGRGSSSGVSSSSNSSRGAMGGCVATLLLAMQQSAVRYAHVTQPVCDRELEEQRNTAAQVAAAVAAGAPAPPQASAKGESVERLNPGDGTIYLSPHLGMSWLRYCRHF